MTESRNPAVAALVLRLSLGTMFIAHALLKYFVFTLPGTAQFFAIARPARAFSATRRSPPSSSAACCWSWACNHRVVALALVPVLLGATWAHAGNGWVFTAPNGGWEYPAFWTVTLIVQALLGDGAYALRPSRPATRCAPGLTLTFRHENLAARDVRCPTPARPTSSCRTVRR